MTNAAPGLTAQADAVENVVLSQQAWLRQAETQEGKRAEQLAYPILCTRLHLPALEAAAATLRALAGAGEPKEAA